MALQAVHLAPVGEKENDIVGIGHGEQSHGVALSGYHPDNPFTTAVLGGVKAGGNPFNIAPAAQRHHHPLVRDKVLLTELHLPTLDDFGPPLIAVLFLKVADLLLDKDEHAARVGEKVFQIGNRFQ